MPVSVPAVCVQDRVLIRLGSLLFVSGWLIVRFCFWRFFFFLHQFAGRFTSVVSSSNQPLERMAPSPSFAAD